MAADNVKRQSIELVEHGHHDAVQANADTTLWETIKSNPFAIFYCILMTIGPLIYGFDSIIVGAITAMPSFQTDFGSRFGEKLIIPAIWLALWNAMVQLGVMIGAVCNAPLTDRFGRRVSFVIGGAISMAAVAVCYISNSNSDLTHRRGVFLAGKTVLGISLGILQSTCQTYISEVAPPKLRGPLLSVFTFFLVVGQLIGISIIFARIAILDASGYKVTIATQWIFAGMAMVFGIIIPESPVHLVRRGKMEKAVKSYSRLYSADAVAGIQHLNHLLAQESTLNEAQNASSYLECFKGSNLRRTRIIIYANVLQQCLGVALLSNATYFLQLGGMSPSLSLQITEVGFGLGLIANVISWFAMTTLGRRFIILASTAVVGLMWLSVGIAGCFNSSASLWYIGVMLMVILVTYGLGVGGAYPVVGGESSSVRLRAHSQGIGFIVNGFFSWLFSFVVPYIFNTDEANLGGKTGFVFAGLCLIALIVVWFELPEMKNRTYDELDEMFENRIPTRSFKNYTCTGLGAIVPTPQKEVEV